MSINRNLAFLIVAVGAWVGCATSDTLYSWPGVSRLTNFDSSMAAGSLLEVQWWTTWQEGPVWHLIIAPDGVVTETIERRGKLKRKSRKSLKPEALQRIVLLASEVRYAQLDRRYECSEDDAGKVFLGVQTDDWKHGVVLDGPYDEWCFECTPEMERFVALWNVVLDEVPPSAGRQSRDVWRLQCELENVSVPVE